MANNIYPNPNFPTAPQDDLEFNKNRAMTFSSKIEQLERKIQTKLRKTKKRKQKLDYLSEILAIISGISSTTSIGMFASMIGLPVGLPLAAVSVVTTTSGFISHKISKHISKKRKRYFEIYDEVLKTKAKYELTLSKSLSDGITTEEFVELQKTYMKLLNVVNEKSKIPVDQMFSEIQNTDFLRLALEKRKR